jgi:hypothetical protein
VFLRVVPFPCRLSQAQVEIVELVPEISDKRPLDVVKELLQSVPLVFGMHTVLVGAIVGVLTNIVAIAPNLVEGLSMPFPKPPQMEPPRPFALPTPLFVAH